MSISRFLQGVALLAVVALALFVASGCGGSDGGATAEDGSGTAVENGGDGGATAEDGSGDGGAESEGGIDGGVAVESGSLSKAQFIAKADNICMETREQLLSEYSEYLTESNPSSPDEEKEALEGVVEDLVLPDYEKLVEEISQLGAPSADTKEVSAFLDALQNRLAEIESKPVELTETTTPFKAVGKLAAAYGLKGCAQTFS